MLPVLDVIIFLEFMPLALGEKINLIDGILLAIYATGTRRENKIS